MKLHAMTCFLVLFVYNYGVVICQEILPTEVNPNEIDVYSNGWAKNYAIQNESDQGTILRKKRDLIAIKNMGPPKIVDNGEINGRRITMRYKNRKLQPVKHYRRNFARLKSNGNNVRRLKIIKVKYGLNPSIRIYKIKTVRKRRKKKPIKVNIQANPNSESGSSEEGEGIDSIEDEAASEEETSEDSMTDDTEAEGEGETSDDGNSEDDSEDGGSDYASESTEESEDTATEEKK